MVDNGASVVDNGAPVVDNGASVVDNGASVVDNGAPVVDYDCPKTAQKRLKWGILTRFRRKWVTNIGCVTKIGAKRAADRIGQLFGRLTPLRYRIIRGLWLIIRGLWL